MTEQEKQLLVKALCGYLPYGMKVEVCIKDKNIKSIDCVKYDTVGTYIRLLDEEKFSVKPFFRTMSNMTEEELNECVCQSGIKDIECPNWQDIPKEKQFEARLNHAIAVFLTDSNNVDWLNAHHFDYRGLIEKGLALEAPEGMYN